MRAVQSVSGKAVARFMAAVVAVVGTAVLAGCGSDTQPQTQSVLQVHVGLVQAVKVLTGESLDPAVGAQTIKNTVSGPGMEDVSTSYNYKDGPGGSGELPVFPEGYERQVTVEICRGICEPAAIDDIISRGRSVPIRLQWGDTKSQTVFVAPRNSFVLPARLGDNGAVVKSNASFKERVGATVTRLDDGTMLIIGGATIKGGAASWYRPEDISSVTANAEIYDPRTGVFSATAGPLKRGRAYHAAVLLGGPNKADGRVVVMGGYESKGGGFVPTASVEIFDPDTGKFVEEPVDRWLSGAGRALLTAGLAYPDEDVIFLAGGISDPSDRGAWLLYKAGTGTVGAGGLAPAEVGPENGRGKPRWNHTMTFLPNYGKSAGGTPIPAFVLMGGENDSEVLSEVEAYQLDPWNGGSSSVRRDVEAVTTALPVTARTLHAAVYVPGQDIVWVIGGFEDRQLSRPINRVEVFRAGSLSFTAGEYLEMAEGRGGMSATLSETLNNSILIAGGRGTGGPLVRTEMILEKKVCSGADVCIRQPFLASDRTPEMESPRVGHTASLDPTGRLLILGGVSDFNTIPAPIFYNPD